MKNSELLRLAFNAIIGNKLRSFLTTLGITIGVFSIIVLVSIGSGLQTYITKEISSLGSNVMFIVPGSGGIGALVSNKLTLADANNLRRILNSTAKMTPEVRQVETFKYKNLKTKSAFVIGASAHYPDVVSSLKITQGNFFTSSQEQSGSNVAVVGQTVLTKLFNGQNPIGKRIYIGNQQYTIVGVFGKIGSFAGFDADNSAIIPVEAASKQYSITTVSRIDVAAKNKELIPVVLRQIKNYYSRKLTTDDYSIQTADSLLSTVSTVTTALSLALGGIAAISLLVGGIGVANIMLVSVTERTREIGLRKALGAKRSDILKQFLLESVVISVFGGTLGIILGMLVSLVIAVVLVSTVTPWSVILAFGFSVLVGVVFGMAPAIRASKLNPIDALRYE